MAMQSRAMYFQCKVDERVEAIDNACGSALTGFSLVPMSVNVIRWDVHRKEGKARDLRLESTLVKCGDTN